MTGKRQRWAGSAAGSDSSEAELITAQAPLDVFAPDSVLYGTKLGAQIVGDSMDLLAVLPEESVDLIVTSPPFALLRQKSYGNEEQSAYVRWLAGFGKAALRVLKPTGSLVLDLGHAYQRGVPVRSLYNYRVLLTFVDELGYFLAQEFFWHNPAKLPSPIEWVNKRKIRVKDSVNTVWWLSKTEHPKADVRNVLGPYSPRMEQLLKGAESFYAPGVRPSGHDIGEAFRRNNGGSIPPNLLTLSNTESNSYYLRVCKPPHGRCWWPRMAWSCATSCPRRCGSPPVENPGWCHPTPWHHLVQREPAVGSRPWTSPTLSRSFGSFATIAQLGRRCAVVVVRLPSG